MKNETTTGISTGATPNKFQARVIQAAENVLAREGSIGPLELFREMLLLQPIHLERWRNGHPSFRFLEEHIEVGPAKFEKAIRYFREWVKERDLRPFEAAYTRRTPKGIEQLQVTSDGNPARETFYRTHFAPADLPEKKKARLTEKRQKAPDIVVFQTVRNETQCSECETELFRGDFLFMEKDQPVCLTCADLGHLVFLPAGDAAMSRRARKHSPLSAVVVRFNRSRKRYERQGVLVTEEALAQAEKECAADAPERAAARARAAEERKREDRKFSEDLMRAIREQFPGCPADEARRIAEHTGLRSSGRVGRSAAGRALDPQAVELAVTTHIRHTHTGYDTLLMQGTERGEARAKVRNQIAQILTNWANKGL